MKGEYYAERRIEVDVAVQTDLSGGVSGSRGVDLLFRENAASGGRRGWVKPMRQFL